MFLRNKPLEDVVVYLDNKAFLYQKELDKLRYERKKFEKKIKKVREKLLFYDNWLHRRTDRKEKEEDIRYLENQLEKVRLKTETAESIGVKYEQVIGCLQEDFHTMPKRLEHLEKSLSEYKIEAKQMSEMRLKAIKLRNDTKEELTTLEKVTFEDRQSKENEIISIKREIENRSKENQELREKKNFKCSPAFGNDFNNDRPEVKRREIQDLKEKLENYEATIRQLQNATRVTDLQKVVERIIIQREVTELLERQKEDAERQRNYYLSLKNDTMKQLIEARYSTKGGKSDWIESMDEMRIYVKNANLTLKSKKNELVKQAELLRKTIKGANYLIEKTSTPTVKGKTVGDLCENLRQCSKKLNNMQNMVKKLSNGAEIQQIINNDQFQDMLKKINPKRHCHSVTNKAPFIDDFYESEDNEDVLTREGNLIHLKISLFTLSLIYFSSD